MEELGEVCGIKVCVRPEDLEDLKKQKLIQENKILAEQQEEINRLNNIINEAIEYINENWGHWCSNHCKYATETIDILQGSDKE